MPGLLNKLQTQGSNQSLNNGGTPSVPDFAASKLHDTYSVNGMPSIQGQPSPSQLDLDGVTPPKYLDNPPG